MRVKQTIILARHGDASWALSDYDRPLSEKGQSDIRNAALFLLEKNLQPDLIVYSPSRRTRDSFELVRRACSRTKPMKAIEYEPLYQCTVEHILDACCLGEDIPNLMVLAHNPGLADFLDYVIEDGSSVVEQHDDITPGTMVAIETAYDSNMLTPRKGKILDWFSPSW
jgi:phosphohistidine phosphatase